MLRVTWRNLVERKVRLLLSAVAIVIGVAFVAGTFIFTDALDGTFDDIIEGSTSDVEVAFKGANDFQSLEDDRLMPPALVEKISRLPEVGSAHPQLALQSVYAIGADGKAIGAQGPPGLAFIPSDAVAITGRPIQKVIDGEYPDAPYEVALLRATAERAEVEVGDQLDLVTPGREPRMTVTVTGIFTFGGGDGAGASMTLFDQDFMRRQFYDGRAGYQSMSLNAAPGVSQGQLRDAVQAVVPGGIEARTGDEYAAVQKAGFDEAFGFMRTFLLVFAAVALFVGVFMILNTFSILVAQRSRELALLRALGASRRQINRSVLVEAFVVGLLGSTLGLVTGYGLARLLAFMFGLFGLDLSGATFAIAPRTVWWSYAVGLVVTMVAAYLPARRAGTIPPVQALRDDVALPEGTLRRRVVIGVLVAVAGVGAIVAGFAGDGSGGLTLIGGGMAVVLVGAAMVSPVLARPVIHLFGVPYRRFAGAIGRLAEQNSQRNPRRTAATASALMIGMTLVALMSIVATSSKASVDSAVQDQLTSQLVVSAVGAAPFSAEYADQIRELDDVESVAAFRQIYGAQINGHEIFAAAAVDAHFFTEAVDLPVSQGTVEQFLADGIVLAPSVAGMVGAEAGDKVTFALQGAELELTVAAITNGASGIPADVLVTYDAIAPLGVAHRDSMVFVNAVSPATLPQVRSEIERILADNPIVAVQDPQEYADQVSAQIDTALLMIYALLALSVLIAILGVVNTLGLSVIERTREIGLLRAIGMSRSQLRRMIRLESVVIAVFGALLGIVLGVAFGIGLITALESEGLTDLAIPWVRLALFVLLAGLVGVVAAVFPAWRAARLDVLRAISTE